MDRTDREHRHQPHLQSSLPRSLIPHLYSGPQQPRCSQTRTTLQKEDCLPYDRLQSCRLSPLHPVSPPSFDQHRRQLPPFYLTTSDAHLGRSVPDPASTPMHRADTTPPSSFLQTNGSPIYSDPVYNSTARPSMASNRGYSYNLAPFTGHRAGLKSQTIWREGEAGPSSLASHDGSLSNYRLGLRQPLRVDMRSSESYRRTSPGAEQVPPIQDQSRNMRERNSHHPSSNRPWPRDNVPQPDQSYERLPGPSQLLDLSLHEQSSSRERSYESQDSYSTVGSLTGVSLSCARERSPATVSPHRTVSCATSNDGDEGSPKGKRRREESVEASPNTETTNSQSQRGTPKKTAVACNFCRGRKLRCNGDRPKCHNCGVRNFECEYVPVQRRRGPGKAPKGSRSKKVTSGHPGSSSKAATDRPSSMIAEHELEALAPEVRPYMSVLSLNSFGSHLPPSYPQPPTTTGESSRHHPRRRTSRNPETSSWEARSDAERNP